MSSGSISQRPKGYNSDYNFYQSSTLKDVATEFPNLKVEKALRRLPLANDEPHILISWLSGQRS